MPRSLFALASALLLTACNEENPAALFADVAYQVRCLDCEPRVADDPARELAVVDGEQGTSLRCESVNGRVSLEVVAPGYAFKVIDARLGNDPGDQCEVRITEGVNEFRGSCKPDGASGSAPCEVELTRSGSGFDGTVLCKQIRHHRTASLFRYVVSPGTTDEPAAISAQGCVGL